MPKREEEREGRGKGERRDKWFEEGRGEEKRRGKGTEERQGHRTRQLEMSSRADNTASQCVGMWNVDTGREREMSVPVFWMSRVIRVFLK